MRGRRCDARIHLPERRNVVEHPEAAPVRGDHEFVALHDEVGDRDVGHVEPQRLPVRAVVVRDVDAVLSRRVEQTAAILVLAHCMDVVVGTNALDDLGPAAAEVGRAEDVR